MRENGLWGCGAAGLWGAVSPTLLEKLLFPKPR